MFAAPAVMRYWNSPPPKDLAEAGEWSAHLEDMQRRLGYAQWRVGERAGDRLVGIAGLQPLDGGPEVELTYALEPSAWGKGYATEAGAAALEYGFGEAGLDRVVAIAKEANRGSVAVLRRLGMRPLGAARYWGSVLGEVRAAGERLAGGAGGGDAAAADRAARAAPPGGGRPSSRWPRSSATPW